MCVCVSERVCLYVYLSVCVCALVCHVLMTCVSLHVVMSV